MITNTLALELEEFKSDFLVFQKKKEELRKKFLNKFVAIKNGKVIASGTSIEEVKDILEKQNVDPSKSVIEFLPEEETIMVL